MQYMVVFGAPVVADGKTLGKVERLLVHNGVANQFTVDPGLFGTERVLPLSDVRAATEQGIELRVDEDAWKAYPAYNIEELLPPQVDPMAGVDELTPQTLTAPAQSPTVEVASSNVDVPGDVTVSAQSAVLSAKTRLLHNNAEHALHGVVLDTGRPVVLLAANGHQIDVGAVRSFSSEQIQA